MSMLEKLEMEIKDYCFTKRNWNYQDKEVEYLFDFSDFVEG